MTEKRVLLCAGTGCISSGVPKVKEALDGEVAQRGLGERITVVATGCHGFCEQGPLVVVEPDEVFYCRVGPEDVPELVERHLVGGEVVERLLYVDPVSGEKAEHHLDIGFYASQMRIALRNCGVIDPESIEEYLGRDGYTGLRRALAMAPAEVIAEVKRSGLRGRGGGGFPTGLKWEFTYQAAGEKKYVVCNADEGDPGAFMDRSLLEGDPHAVIEGMLIGAYAIGADEGYVYCRAEYPLAIKRLRLAIESARAHGYLGQDILGTGFGFELHVKEGAGAFVCGEETALLASIMGERGMPRPRPPYPAQKGLWDRPTNINNVETWANVPQIISRGAEWYASLGTEHSKGTKVFALTGKVRNTGLVEVPMGMTIRQIVFDIGGGVQGDGRFKAVQIGGPSGGCLPESLIDTPVDYDSLLAAGAMMGSGGMVIVDETTCMVDLARYFMAFIQSESCGKCPPCRVGTRLMLECLERICEGEGRPSDIEWLGEMGRQITAYSLCGLGRTAANPVLTTIRYFRDEYEAHVNDKNCPAGACSALTKYAVIAEACTGCTLCVRACPVDAITGVRRQPHVIDAATCISCGACLEACRFGAISRGGADQPKEAAGS